MQNLLNQRKIVNKSSTIFEHIRRTADDLTTLEINTIIKDDMTCFNPPADDRMVLYMLGKAYHYKIKEFGAKYFLAITNNDFSEKVKNECLMEVNGKTIGLNLFRGKIEFAGGGIFSFRELSTRAGNAIKWIQANSNYLSISEEQQKMDIMMLSRIEGKSFEVCRAIEKLLKIKDNELFKKYQHKYWEFDKELDASAPTYTIKKVKLADQQKVLYNRLPTKYKEILADETSEEFLNPKDDSFEFEFDIRDKLLIRKSIDLGVEKVVLQTLISMDGDITTRISEKFAIDPNQFVLNLHSTSIDISVSFWNKLFDALIGFGKKLIDKKL